MVYVWLSGSCVMGLVGRDNSCKRCILRGAVSVLTRMSASLPLHSLNASAIIELRPLFTQTLRFRSHPDANRVLHSLSSLLLPSQWIYC